MSTLANSSSINSSGNWNLCDPTSELDSETANAIPPTTSGATSRSAGFTPGAITIDALLVKLASRQGSTGTLTVELYNSTLAGLVTGGAVTINISDIQNYSTNALPGGWLMLKLAAPITLLSANVYMVDIITSNNSQVRMYAGSGNDWSRQLRTTTTQAKAVNDKLIICGDKTGAGAGNSYTVTWLETATTIYGPSAASNALTVNDGGTLTLQTTASTAYIMNLLGSFVAYAGSTVNFGTSGTPLPSTSSFILTFQNAANVDCGFIARALCTINVYGASKTSIITRMTVDKVATNTVITLLDTTGWAISDVLVFAPTTRTNSEAESKIISTVDSSTQVTLTAGLTNAHSGTNDANGDIRAEVGNLTRNIKIQGNTSTLGAYVYIETTAIVTLRYCEFTKLGSNTSSKRGFDINTTTGTFDCQYCSIHDCTVTNSIGFNILSASGSNITISNNVCFNIANNHLINVATSGVQTISNNMFCRNTDASTHLVILADVGGVFSNNFCSASMASGVNISSESAILNTFSNNYLHANAANGLLLGSITGTISFTANQCHRNAQGVAIVNIAATSILTLDAFNLFGNSNYGIVLSLSQGGGPSIGVLFTNAILNAGVTLTQPVGVQTGQTTVELLRFENCTFGATTSHATADINVGSINSGLLIWLYNCLLASTIEVLNQANLTLGGFIASSKHDQTVGNFKYWTRNGTISYDSSIFNTSSPSQRQTPNTSGAKIESSPIKLVVLSGQTATLNVYVRKSVVGDGAAYNGNQPRLILKKNVAAGISADTVLVTAVSANGVWEQLSGTTIAVTDDCELQFIVDCDGTAGWINIDDISTPMMNVRTGVQFWADGLPSLAITNALSFSRRFSIQTYNNRASTPRKRIVAISSSGGGGTVNNYFIRRIHNHPVQQVTIKRIQRIVNIQNNAFVRRIHNHVQVQQVLRKTIRVINIPPNMFIRRIQPQIRQEVLVEHVRPIINSPVTTQNVTVSRRRRVM